MRVVIGTHNALDDELGTLLAEALPDPEMPELDRIGFTLKVDLLIAMRVLWSGVRPAWRDFNRLRNTFAHDVRPPLRRLGPANSDPPCRIRCGPAKQANPLTSSGWLPQSSGSK